jgi:hypothetical protein
MMEAIHSFKPSVLKKATWHNIPEDGILHSHHYENLKSYKNMFCMSKLKCTTEYTVSLFTGAMAMKINFQTVLRISRKAS